MNQLAVSSPSARAGAGCALCGTALPDGAPAMADGHPVCLNCSAQVERELAEQAPTMASVMPATALGLVGAFVGALVWTVVAVVTSLVTGFVAVLVGYLAGTGVKLGAGKARGQVLQVLAAALAVVGFVLARYMIVAHEVLDRVGSDMSYLDPRIVAVFGNIVGELLSPFDLLWIVLAVAAAYRVPAARRVKVQR